MARTFTPNAQGNVLWLANFTAGSTYNVDWEFNEYDPDTGSVTGNKDLTDWQEDNLEMVLSWTDGGSPISGFAATFRISGTPTDGIVNIKVSATVTQALQTAGQALTPPLKHGYGVIRGTNGNGETEDLMTGRFLVKWTPA